jgi:NADPH-dependent ferric siderophore reductase
VDRPGQRLVVDFVLHGDNGPASAWAPAARVGDQLVVTGARGAYRIDPEAGWTLLVADETALPAVGTIMDEAPAGEAPAGAPVLLVAEVADQGEQLKFDTAAELDTVWCHCDQSSARFGPGRTAYTRPATVSSAAAGRPVRSARNCRTTMTATAARTNASITSMTVLLPAYYRWLSQGDRIRRAALVSPSGNGHRDAPSGYP